MARRASRLNDRHLARYLRTIYAFAAEYRAVFDGAGLGRDGVRRHADLALVPPTDIDEVDPSRLVQRPTASAIAEFGPPALRRRLFVARHLGLVGRFNRVTVDPAYKPLHWVANAGMPLAYSHTDLVRLGTLGQRWLRLAGIGTGDSVANLLPHASLAHWQIVLGARRCGIPAATVGAGDLRLLEPTVVVGSFDQLEAAFRQRHLSPTQSRPRLLVCVDDPERLRRGELREVSGGAAVLGAWVPPAARAAWVQCAQAAGSDADSTLPALHTWDDCEIIETATDGELLWTATQWRGTAMLRARTGQPVSIDRGVCSACGRPGPTVTPQLAALASEPAVLIARVERRRSGRATGLIAHVHLRDGADAEAVVRRLHDRCPLVQVVVDEASARSAMAAAGRA